MTTMTTADSRVKAPVTAITLEPLLTLEELAELTRTSKSTLYSLCHEGRGPVGFRVGRSLRFRPADVVAWLDDLADGSASDEKVAA